MDQVAGQQQQRRWKGEKEEAEEGERWSEDEGQVKG
jgi:hypothetical protein